MSDTSDNIIKLKVCFIRIPLFQWQKHIQINHQNILFKHDLTWIVMKNPILFSWRNKLYEVQYLKTYASQCTVFDDIWFVMQSIWRHTLCDAQYFKTYTSRCTVLEDICFLIHSIWRHISVSMHTIWKHLFRDAKYLNT